MSSKYRNSKKRFALLLVQLTGLVYTVVYGTYEAKLLACLLFPLWFIAALSWRNK